MRPATRSAEPAAAGETTPLDAMLDLAEQAIRTVVDQGGEAALRARLARLLPVAPAPAPAHHTGIEIGLAPLDLATVVTVCVRLGRYRLSGEEHAAIARLREVANREIQRINATKREATP